jgi:Ca2+-dependent lipid-binding protein
MVAKLETLIIKLHKRRIVGEQPNPIIPFILFFVILLIGFATLFISFMFAFIFFGLAIFTLIFAILHMIVSLTIKKFRKNKK